MVSVNPTSEFAALRPPTAAHEPLDMRVMSKADAINAQRLVASGLRHTLPPPLPVLHPDPLPHPRPRRGVWGWFVSIMVGDRKDGDSR